MTPVELIEILKTVPSNSQLINNNLGNIVVTVDDKYVGYIDMKWKSYNPIDEDDTLSSTSP
jgi:hypothetical protein